VFKQAHEIPVKTLPHVHMLGVEQAWCEYILPKFHNRLEHFGKTCMNAYLFIFPSKKMLRETVYMIMQAGDGNFSPSFST